MEEIERNSPLRENLEKVVESAQKLEALNEEIEANPNVRQLKEIIASASRRQPTLDEAIEDLPPCNAKHVLAYASNDAGNRALVHGNHQMKHNPTLNRTCVTIGDTHELMLRVRPWPISTNHR